MKSKVNLIRIIFIIFFLLANQSFAKLINIKYIVEDKVITNIDIRNEINYLLLINKSLSELSDELLVEYSTKSLLKEKIKEVELSRHFIFGQNDSLINQQLNKFKINLNIGNDENFDELLSRVNLNEEFLSKKIEIELLWNKLIYEKFINQVNIDENKMKEELSKKIENSQEEINEYLIHEILFSADTKDELNLLFSEISKSISNIGFDNTANIFSISNTAKFGGKVGWVNETQLSKNILNKIEGLENFEMSEPIQTANGILILMIKDKKKISKKISFEDELQTMLNMEAENQLNQFSQIFFKKIELNTKIYEK